jgi:hypothetical protein
MELKDFVSETIAQIMGGVSGAIKSHDVKSLGGIINPIPASREAMPNSHEALMIEFDVAVTVESGEASSKDGGLNIKVLEASISKDQSRRTVGESRVRFSVPVTLPYTIVRNA